MAKRLLLGAAIFWTLSIAFLCLVSLKELPKIPDLEISEMDKYVHFTFHFGFTFLWSSYFWNTQKELVIRTVFKVFLFSVAYGILIELLQSAFTTSRKGDVMDVLANTTGASIAVIVLIFYTYFNKNKN